MGVWFVCVYLKICRRVCSLSLCTRIYSRTRGPACLSFWSGVSAKITEWLTNSSQSFQLKDLGWTAFIPEQACCRRRGIPSASRTSVISQPTTVCCQSFVPFVQITAGVVVVVVVVLVAVVVVAAVVVVVVVVVVMVVVVVVLVVVVAAVETVTPIQKRHVQQDSTLHHHEMPLYVSTIALRCSCVGSENFCPRSYSFHMVSWLGKLPCPWRI